MVRGREKFARSMVLLPADEMSAHLRAPLAATDLRNAPGGGAVALGGGGQDGKISLRRFYVGYGGIEYDQTSDLSCVNGFRGLKTEMTRLRAIP